MFLGFWAIVLLGIVGGVAWWLGLFSSEPEEATVEAAVEALSKDADADVVVSIDDLNGEWTIARGEATFVGYRVEEVLANIGETTAVGRTPAVDGLLNAEGTTITSVEIMADMTQLKSGTDGRDNHLRRSSLETDTFPEASFSLTGPIDVGSVPAAGETMSFTASGDLTVHGTTNAVEVPLEATVVDDSLVIVGSTEIAMSDYDIAIPSAPIVARVEDVGIMEFSLVFVR